MITPLTSDETRSVLRDGRVGRLACVVEGEPYVVPINYVFEGNRIYAHSMPGRKIEALRANPLTCLQVDEIKDDYHWRSAIAFGRYEEVTDLDEKRSALRVILARFPHLTPVEATQQRAQEGPPAIVFRIVVERVTGVGEGLLRS